jgi:hypothetical protein
MCLSCSSACSYNPELAYHFAHGRCYNALLAVSVQLVVCPRIVFPCVVALHQSHFLSRFSDVSAAACSSRVTIRTVCGVIAFFLTTLLFDISSRPTGSRTWRRWLCCLAWFPQIQPLCATCLGVGGGIRRALGSTYHSGR